MPCHSCGKNFRGPGPTATIDGEERTYCADCYWTLKKQYEQKKTCDGCSFFSNDICKRTEIKLIPATFGVEDFYVQAEHCKYFSTAKVELSLVEIEKLESEGRYEEAANQYAQFGMIEESDRNRLKCIERLELAGRYEDAAREYEKLGMFEKAGDTRKKDKQITVLHVDVNALVKNLAEKGQTLTYYCCHCGAPLKIGAKSVEVRKTCPHCGYDLEVINLGKFINQHVS